MHADAISRMLDNAPAEAIAASETLKRNRSRRAIFLTWLRKTHLYVGLCEAMLGLLFGATGILLNHRTTLKIPLEKTMQKTAQLPLPAQPVASPEQMSS